jgi:peptidyl-prolyl cis-trans isomerase D
MISSFRNFAKTKFAGLLVFLMIIPFVFWGMGSMFSSGNTNNLAKINKTNISTQEFINYVNTLNISQKEIRKNLDNNIVEELLSGLVSTTLLNLEIKDFDITISKNILLKKIKENKNLIDENGIFQRTRYEKFLLENNISAPIFEQSLKNRELQKNLFDFIGAGTVSPKFLIKKLFENENKKLELDFINLNKFYKKKDDIKDQDLVNFVNNNVDKLKVEYIDFKYSIINPKNLIGVDEFNQTFFDKIDQIESDILNGVDFNSLVTKLNLETTKINNFKYSEKSNEIEKKIYEGKDTKLDIFENKNNFIIYNIDNIEQKKPDLVNIQTKEEISKLVIQKNKFNYNRKLLTQINDKKFNDSDFLTLGNNNIKSITLNSIKDNKTFDIKSVEMIYSLPINSFTLVNDEKNQIYLVKIKNFQNETIDENSKKFETYANKENSNNKNNILKSYDLFLNDKYNVVINQKTIERVKNFFQ